MIVVIELQRGRAGVGMSREIFTIDEDDVGIAVIVVVNEGAARAHGFGQPLLAEGAVVVGEVDAGLGSDVAELDLRLRGRGKTKCESTTETRRHGGILSKRKLSPCLCDSVVNCVIGRYIYREAPAEIAAGPCPAGRPRAAVPT